LIVNSGRFNVLITGSSSGIGLATLKNFYEHCDVIFACIQDYSEEFLFIIKDIESHSECKIIPIQFDFNNIEEIKRAFKEIKNYGLDLHSVVSIAGMTKDSIFEMTLFDNLREIIDVNFSNQMLFIQYLIRLMKNSNKSSITFVSSISAIDGNNGQLAYSASKGALISATKTLARELSIYGIRVNCVAPGYINTNMTKQMDQNLLLSMVSKTSLGRIGLPEEVASVLFFLASNLSNQITGQIIRIDGGL
jgi:3-oxoacyl-[acyl-carrier protein] reductase